MFTHPLIRKLCFTAEPQAHLCLSVHVCWSAELEETVLSGHWPSEGQRGSSPLLTGREPKDVLTPVCPGRLKERGYTLTADAVDGGTDLGTDRKKQKVRCRQVVLEAEVLPTGVTGADAMSEHPGVLYLIPEKAVVRRAAQRRHQLLETRSNPAQGVLGALTLTLLPRCRQLIHGTTPPTHDQLEKSGAAPHNVTNISKWTFHHLKFNHIQREAQRRFLQ